MSIAFDQVVTPSGSTTAGSATSISVPFTAASGATVLVGLNTDRNITTPTAPEYNGSAMTLVDSEEYPSSQGWCFVYALVGGGTGSSANFTVTVPTCFWVAAPISFTAVGSVGTGAKTNGSSTTPDSGAITLTTGQVAVSVLAAGSQFANSTISSPTGGTNKFLQTNANTSPSQAINYSGTSGVDFTATCPTVPWSVVTVKLSPPAGNSYSDSANRSVTFTSTVSAGPRTLSDTANRSVTVNRTPAGKLAIKQHANTSIAVATDLLSLGPCTGLAAKLASNTDAILLCAGDSTVYGQQDEDSLGGWVGRLGIILGGIYNVNVTMEIYYPSGNYTTTSQTMYTASGGGRATLTVMNGGSPGSAIVNQLIAGQSVFPVADVDLIILGDGFNDIDLDESNATYVADYEEWITDIQGWCPDSPIIVTAENQTTTNQSEYYSAFSALSTALVGLALPLSPGLSPVSTSYSSLWFLDTQQAFDGYDLSTVLYGPSPLHPVAAGYLVQASWMAWQLGFITSYGDTANRSTGITPSVNESVVHVAGADSAWTVNRPLTGTKHATDHANTTATFTPTVTGVRHFTATANRAITVTATAPGTRSAHSTANRAVTFTPTIAGTHAARAGANATVTVTSDVVGGYRADMAIGFATTIAGKYAARGTANRSISFATFVSNHAVNFDHANSTIAFSSHVVLVPKVELGFVTIEGEYLDVENPPTTGSSPTPTVNTVSGFVTFYPRLPVGTVLYIDGFDLAQAGGSGLASAAVALAPIQARMLSGVLQTINRSGTPTIQLVANTSAISQALAAQGINALWYDVKYTNVVYSAAAEQVTSFSFLAPTSSGTLSITDGSLTKYPYAGP